MKRFVLASVAALGLLSISQQQASAWGSISFGVGISIGGGTRGLFIGAGFSAQCSPRYVPYFPSEFDVYGGGMGYPVDVYAGSMNYAAPAYAQQQPAVQAAPVAARPAAPAPIYQPVGYYPQAYGNYQAPAYWYSR